MAQCETRFQGGCVSSAEVVRVQPQRAEQELSVVLQPHPHGSNTSSRLNRARMKNYTIITVFSRGGGLNGCTSQLIEFLFGEVCSVIKSEIKE